MEFICLNPKAIKMAQVRTLKKLFLNSHSPNSHILRRFTSSSSFSTTTSGGFSSINDHGERRTQTQNQNPPNPKTKKRKKYESPIFSANPYASRGRTLDNMTPPPPPPSQQHQSTDSNISDYAFLDKFKLSFRTDKDKPTPNPQSNPTAETDTKASAAINERSSAKSETPAAPPPDAQEIFKKMKETGLIPNAVAMLDGLCKDGLVQEALKLFHSMRQKGTLPEVVVCTAVVDAFCKAQNLDEAKRIFRKMQAIGILPNAFSYTVLIQGLCKSNLFDDAIDFCLEMLEAGHSPNVATFVGLVDGLCREKGVEEAKNVIATFRQKGFYVNDKALRDFLDRNKPLSSQVWEAIFGKKPERKIF